MARKAAPPKKRRRRWGAWIALALAVVLAAFVGWMALCARTVHVRRAEVALSDLPASMDGTTLLFLSDFSLCGTNTPAQAAKCSRCWHYVGTGSDPEHPELCPRCVSNLFGAGEERRFA